MIKQIKITMQFNRLFSINQQRKLARSFSGGVNKSICTTDRAFHRLSKGILNPFKWNEESDTKSLI